MKAFIMIITIIFFIGCGGSSTKSTEQNADPTKPVNVDKDIQPPTVPRV